MACFQRVVTIFCLLVALGVCSGQKKWNPKGGNQNGQLMVQPKKEPLVPNAPSIMYWRPQKVGSSTVLSLFASFGFRTHAMTRRRGATATLCQSLQRCSERASARTRGSKGKGKGFRGRNGTMVTPSAQSVRDTRAVPGPAGNTGRSRVRENASPGDPSGSASSAASPSGPGGTPRVPFRMSLAHEVCNSPAGVIQDQLPCVFKREVKEVFVVRDPVARAISAYYFWGELARIADALDEHKSALRGNKTAIEAAKEDNHGKLYHVGSLAVGSPDKVIETGRFDYHGSEQTAPPVAIAMKFADSLPYTAGMPGPSYTWSFFANNAEDTVNIMQQPERMMTLVLERLEESLVAMKYYLNTNYTDRTMSEEWELADLVIVMNRRALSPHPKMDKWPSEAVNRINAKLQEDHEYEVYNAASSMLDSRIRTLTNSGVDFQREVTVLHELKSRVTEMCLSQPYLDKYKKHLESLNLQPARGVTRLHEVENKYTDGGHAFSFNDHNLYSFDICGHCEAHGIMVALKNGLGTSKKSKTLNVGNAATLASLPKALAEKHVKLFNCPKPA